MGAPMLVPLSEKYSYTGFTSVYGYSPAAVEQIRRTRSTKDITSFPVYSEELYVDFDNNEEAADTFAQRLKMMEHTFTIASSGNRSVHFHIPIEPMYGVNVPTSQKLWMEENAPGADLTIYRHTGLFRLPGTYHSKNPGNKKVMGETYTGTTLRIENRPLPSVTVRHEASEQTPEFFYMLLGKLINKRASAGGRHTTAYKIAMACQAAGKDEAEASRLLGMWNMDNCHPAKPDWELEKLIRWAYK